MSGNGFSPLWLGPKYPLPFCGGDPYLESGDAPLARWAGLRTDGQLHFAGDPIEFQTMQSFKWVTADGSLGTCENFGAGCQTFFGPETSVPVPDGLTKPFSIVDP